MKRVVHFWNICGIGGLLARYMDRWFDYQTVAVARGEASIYSHNNEKTRVWNNRAFVWVGKCLVYSKFFDILHVHSGIQWLWFYRMMNPGKPIIIHLHGTKIRGRWGKWPGLKYADQILVSTPDLLEGAPEGTVHIPNPVDEELIWSVKYALNKKKRINKAFHVDRYATDRAKEYADHLGVELVVFDRSETPLPHAEFLLENARYEYYIDVKRDYPNHLFEKEILEAWSLTGLEFLALGCKVVDWKGTLHDGIPKEHQSYEIASKLNAVYEGLEGTVIE